MTDTLPYRTAFALYQRGLMPPEIAELTGMTLPQAQALCASWYAQERAGMVPVLPPEPAQQRSAPVPMQATPPDFAPVVVLGRAVGNAVAGTALFVGAVVVGIVTGIFSGLAAMAGSGKEEEEPEYGSREREGGGRTGIWQQEAENKGETTIINHNHYY